MVRAAAYCRLIKTCEGGNAPFGVLMFAGSYDCLVIPNNGEAQSHFERALREVQEFLSVYEGGKFVPAAPTDNRCSGCHCGKPRKHVDGEERHDSQRPGTSAVAYEGGQRRVLPQHVR